MKIGFLSGDWADVDTEGKPSPGGANHARVQIPAKALADAGHEVVIGYAMHQDNKTKHLELTDWDLNFHEGFDVIVTQRWMEMHAAETIDDAVRHGQVVLQDIDDWWFGLSPKNVAFHTTHPKRNAFSNVHFYADAMAASSGLICSTPFLVARMHQKTGAPTHLIRNRIDADRYKATDLTGPTMLGWVGNVASRSGDLETINGVVLPWLRKHPEAGFYHGGADKKALSARTILGIPDDVPGSVMPMQTVANYPRMFRRMNVGLVPLSDVPFNHAKSALKGMEYAAAGIPFVASALPEYEWLERKYGIGIVCRKPRHWLGALERLNDVDERVRLGQEYREKVQALTPRPADRVGLAEEWERAVAPLLRPLAGIAT